MKPIVQASLIYEIFEICLFISFVFTEAWGCIWLPEGLFERSTNNESQKRNRYPGNTCIDYSILSLLLNS